MSYQVPYSSSPPSTPDGKSKNGSGSLFRATNPSTTPAGPPPSSTGSFTPAEPPPSSSIISSTSPLKPLSFGRQGVYKSSPLRFDSNSYSQADKQRRGFQVPKEDGDEDADGDDTSEYPEEDYGNRRHHQNAPDEDEDAMAYEEEQDEHHGDDDEAMDDYGSDTRESGLRSNARDYDGRGSLRQSMEGSSLNLGHSLSDQLGHRKKAFVYGKIAKSLYEQVTDLDVEESDDLILDTETIITKIYDEGLEVGDNEDLLDHVLAAVPDALRKLWSKYQRNNVVYDSEEYAASIGPGPRASKFAKANFLASLALLIHHPQTKEPGSSVYKARPLPEVMLEWMDEYHDPFLSQFEEVQVHRPSPAHHRLFWDNMFNGLIRGRVLAVANMMKNAGWRHARTGTDDVRGKPAEVGYTGVALENVERVMNEAIQVLNQCPAVHGDWNIRSTDWTLFRLRADQALEDLKRFAEGRNRHPSQSASKDSPAGKYARMAQKAESQVPWNVYQNLLTLYNLIMGDFSAIVENSQDWCEATIGLLVWWDEAKNDRRVALSRSLARRSTGRESDAQAYLRKLRRAFEAATSDSPDFQVNTLNPVEIGLASLLEGDNEAVVGILRSWSGPLSSAVAEVASLAGWLPAGEPQNLIDMGGLDDEDLNLLGITSSREKSDSVKDQVLIAYAKSLSRRGQLRSRGVVKQSIVREGWELAIAILARLDSAARSEEMIWEFLAGLHFDSSADVNKLWRLLNALGLSRHAESVAEKYAMWLGEQTHKYGEALWYYALAHRKESAKDVLNLLISLSLVQSVAYPSESELDDYLRQLISSPASTLTELSKLDVEAAELLHQMLSGYATLRKFYLLRDENLGSPSMKQDSGLISQRTQAASSLLVIISSSSDNIRGGLYDPERGAIVSVDFLLALLGEAMVFVNQPEPILDSSQILLLLKAIEDLQTVGQRTYDACDEFLGTVIASTPGLKGSTPADLLRKSTSNLSGTSSFSLVGSSMLASQLKQSMGSSGVLVAGNVKRGWDWRRGVTTGTKGADLLRILRLGLAKDLAKAWLAEGDGMGL